MKKSQIQTINHDVLANVPVEELERRLELEILRPPAALCCSWDDTCGDCCDCTCNDPWGYCAPNMPCPLDVPCGDCTFYGCNLYSG